MIQSAQTKALALGKEGCYFFSLLYIAEEEGAGPLDVLRVFDEAIASGFVKNNGYVENPSLLMTMLTGAKWDVFKAGPGHNIGLDYALKPGEREVLRYEWNDLAHFVVGNGRQGIAYNPYPGSLPVVRGRLMSRRILRRT